MELKKKTNNFSEKRLKLADIQTFYSFNLDKKIDDIIKDFEKLLSRF